LSVDVIQILVNHRKDAVNHESKNTFPLYRKFMQKSDG
jgi:hypothetical protein